MSKIFVVAYVPAKLDRAWLQHLRDFDVAHPECHFEVLAENDGPERSLTEIIEMLKIDPELSVMQVWKRGKRSG